MKQEDTRVENIKVESLEGMKKADYPHTLQSGGLGPCIAIAFYNPRTKSGYMIHTPHPQYANLDDEIRKIQNDFGTLSKVRVFVAGNSLASYESPEEADFVRSGRPFIRRKLREYFRDSQVRIKWSPRDHMAELYLHTLNGKFELELEPLPCCECHAETDARFFRPL